MELEMCINSLYNNIFGLKSCGKCDFFDRHVCVALDWYVFFCVHDYWVVYGNNGYGTIYCDGLVTVGGGWFLFIINCVFKAVNWIQGNICTNTRGYLFFPKE